MAFQFVFCSDSLEGRVQFKFLHFLILGWGSILGKTWVLVRFILAGLGFFPTSTESHLFCIKLNIGVPVVVI